jgi:hypothetical protein
MYSSTRAGTSPWIPWFRCNRSRTSVEETWLATVVNMCTTDFRSTIFC